MSDSRRDGSGGRHFRPTRMTIRWMVYGVAMLAAGGLTARLLSQNGMLASSAAVFAVIMALLGVVGVALAVRRSFVHTCARCGAPMGASGCPTQACAQSPSA